MCISFKTVNIYSECWKLNITLRILLLVLLLYYHKRAMLHLAGVRKTDGTGLGHLLDGSFSQVCVLSYLGGIVTVQ